MTKFIATFEFGSNITTDQAQEWFETIRSHMPDGTNAVLKREPLMIPVKDLTDAHKGETIKVYVDKKTGLIDGKLDAVFPAGRQGESRTLIINGTAYTVNFGVAQLSDW